MTQEKKQSVQEAQMNEPSDPSLVLKINNTQNPVPIPAHKEAQEEEHRKVTGHSTSIVDLSNTLGTKPTISMEELRTMEMH